MKHASNNFLNIFCEDGLRLFFIVLCVDTSQYRESKETLKQSLIF